MKRLVLALSILALLFSSSLYSNGNGNFHETRYDNFLYFEGAGIGATAIWVFNKEVFNIKEDYGILTVGIPVILVGVLKEHNDKGHISRNSLRDISCVALGAITGKIMTYRF